MIRMISLKQRPIPSHRLRTKIFHTKLFKNSRIGGSIAPIANHRLSALLCTNIIAFAIPTETAGENVLADIHRTFLTLRPRHFNYNKFLPANG